MGNSVCEMGERPYNVPWGIGCDRWAAEHWVGSHPDVEPCDLYAGGYKQGYNFDRPQIDGTWVPQLYEGFRFGLWFYGKGGSEPKQWEWGCSGVVTSGGNCTTSFHREAILARYGTSRRCWQLKEQHCLKLAGVYEVNVNVSIAV